MRNRQKKVVVFDLDETLGHFVELGVFCDVIEKFYKKKLTNSEFNEIVDLFPIFLRPKMIRILLYLKEQKIKKNIYKVYIYTNNQGPKAWAEKIKLYLEEKINYTLFDKIIAAYKVNGKIVEKGRTTHDKTIDDFLTITKLSHNTKICFLDDLYHPEMDSDNVMYIHVKPYSATLSFSDMAEIYYDSNNNILNANMKSNASYKQEFVSFVRSHMNRYSIRVSNKSQIEYNDDIKVSKEILDDLRTFIKVKWKNKTTKLQKPPPKRTTRKNIN